MTNDEKLDELLEWAGKTKVKIEEMIYVVNQITDHLNEFNGQALPEIKEFKKHKI